MTDRRPTACVACVFLDACDTTADALGASHLLARRHLHPVYTHHPEPDLVTWSARVEDALSASLGLLRASPRARLVLDVGEPASIVPVEGFEPIVTSEASRRALSLARASDRAGVFATRAFALSCGSAALASLGLPPEPPAGASLIELASPTHDDALADAIPPALAEYSRLVSLGMAELERDDDPVHLIELDEARDPLMATLTRHLEVAPDACARVLVSLSRWLNPIWMRPDAVAACASLLEGGRVEDGPLSSALRVVRGVQLRKSGDLEEAVAALSGVAADDSCDPATRGLALNELGNAHASLGAYDDAQLAYERAAALALDHGLDGVHCHAHRGLAVLTMNRAEVMTPAAKASVFEHLELALSMAVAAGDRQATMLVMGERANVLSLVDPIQARAHLLDVIALARSSHVPQVASAAVGICAEIAIRRARIQEARQLLDASRGDLVDGDEVGRWFASLRDGFLALYSGDFERSDALSVSLGAGAAHLGHPAFDASARAFELLAAVAAGRFEHFKLLRGEHPEHFVDRWDMICALGDALAAHTHALEFADGEGALDPALAALHEHLVSGVSGRFGDEWRELTWFFALTTFPERFAPARELPTLVVDADAGWFVAADGLRVELSHRPYLHQLFRAFVTHHAAADPTAIDTFALFEIGWPGVNIGIGAMKNRVYVGIANLRKLGLHPWLIHGADGYALDPELTVMRCLS